MESLLIFNEASNWTEEPASAHQKAFLFRRNIDVPESLTKDQASEIISRILEKARAIEAIPSD